jgi:cytochrome c
MKAAALLISSALLVSAASGAAPSGDPIAGRKAFGMQCRACHQVAKGAGSTTAPNLAEIAGRAAAADSEFEYSPALRTAAAAGLKWDGPNLDHFLAKPQATVPGTSMPVSVANPIVRADILAYLATLSP